MGVARCSRSRPGGLKLLGRERYVLLYHERKATNGQPPFRSPSSCPRGICPGTGLLPYCYSAFFVAPPLAVPANVFSSGKDSRASLRVEVHLLEGYVASTSGRGKKGPTPLEGLLQGVVEKPPNVGTAATQSQRCRPSRGVGCFHETRTGAARCSRSRLEDSNS